jgi:hypothetical protein
MTVLDFVHSLAIVWCMFAALAVAAGIWETYDQHRELAERARSRRHAGE